jgi:probable F420-dependent oxidoreductase
MRFGVALPANGPHATAAFIREFAVACEQLGFDGLWIADHMSWSVDDAAARFPGWASGQDPEQLTPDQYEPVATLSFLAGVTQHIRLGTAVLVLPVRNPVVLAREIASLDQLSGGRISLGVAVGGTNHAAADFGAVGLQHLKPRRGRATDEWIEVIRRVWTERSCTYHGTLIEIDDAWIFPKPARSGGPPILIGGDSEHALARVARLADGSIVSRLPPTMVADRRRELADRARPHGRSDVHFDLVVSQWLSIDDDHSAAAARAERSLGGVRRGGRPITGDRDNMVGTPARLLEMVGEYEAAGIDELLLQVVGDSEAEVLDSLCQFSEDVMGCIRSGVRA